VIEQGRRDLDGGIAEMDKAIMNTIRAQEEAYIKTVTDYLRRKEGDLKSLILQIEKKHGAEGQNRQELINSLKYTIVQLESDLGSFEIQLRSKTDKFDKFKE
jgi:hypothetical protein